MKTMIDKLLRDYQEVEARLKHHETALEEATEELENTQEAQAIVVAMASGLQAAVHSRLSAVVTKALKAVFDDPYEFALRFETKANRTNVVLVFTRDGLEVDAPLDACGGGVVDVAAWALRMACLILARPHARRLLVLDEPFKFVWAGGRDKVAQLVSVLSSELGVQLLIVTHEQEYELGNVIRL